MVPAEHPLARGETVRHEPVADDEQPVRVPEGAGRRIEDRRGQPHGPCPGRMVYPNLGPTEPVRIGRDQGTVIGQPTTGLGEGKEARSLAAAGPAPPRADATPTMNREQPGLE